MAPNLAAMLTRNTRKIVVILAYAFLEWVLILLILSNSIFSYIIRKFAIYFGLKQPCILCSRVDQLLEPAKTTDSYRAVVCEIHATEISRLSYCSNHKRFAESHQMCDVCFLSTYKNVQTFQTDSNDKIVRCSCCATISSKKNWHSLYFPFRGSPVITELEEDKVAFKANVSSNRSSLDFEPHILSDAGSVSLREVAAKEDGNENDDHAESGGNQTENSRNEGRMLSKEESGHLLLSSDGKKFKIQQSHQESISDVSQDIFFKLEQLKSDLESEQKARNELYSELEAERNAAAVAANQTMAMITRLQEEKAAMQMEALHYQRVMEEQSEYDQEALQLLNELVAKREKEKEELEKVLQGYRERFSDMEAKEAMLRIQKGNLSPSCSIDNDSDVLSIDLNQPYNKQGDIINKDMSLMECSEQWGAIEDSLEELEEERMSIIKQIRELEVKLQKGEKHKEEILFEEHKSELEPNVALCSQEVNLVSCFPSNVTSENSPKTMASVARKLLDLVEADNSSETEEMSELNDKVGSDEEIVRSRVENGSTKRLALEKEMDHVYGRLQALEADTEFLRHCIASINKGNEGLNLLQEILQHLRELRDAEICM